MWALPALISRIRIGSTRPVASLYSDKPEMVLTLTGEGA